MVPTGLFLAVSVPCAAAMGYAAQRGSICAVRGVEAFIDGGSARLLLSFFLCAAWVALVSLPLIWLRPGDVRLAEAIWPTPAIAAGAFVFGIGAAINGGCSFATVLRLGGGELSFAATLVGLSAGFALHRWLPGAPAAPLPSGPSPLATPHAGSLALLGIAATVAVAGLWPPRPARRARPAASRRWRPEAAVAVMGVAGGVLYAIHGSWMYTVALDRGFAAMMARSISNPELAGLFAALLGGAAVAARRTRRLRLRLRPRDAALRLGAGVLMGFGAALVPGGNDVLVLHALPALSPHALPAYAAMLLGILAAVGLRRVATAAAAGAPR
jgi:uncharacterized membrane protein YedE/YeeE